MRKLDSPVPKVWPGHVMLYDPIPLVTVAQFEKAMRERPDMGQAEVDSEILPAIFPCVAEWHLNSTFPEGVTVETFPGTPRRASARLIAGLISEIVNIYKGDEETDPNE